MPNQLCTSIYLYDSNTDIEEGEIATLEGIIHTRLNLNCAAGYLSDPGEIL